MSQEALLNLIVTEEDRREVIDLLDRVYESFFKTGDNPQVIESDEKYGPALLEALPSDFDKQDYINKCKIIRDIEKSVKELPRTEIILATPPTESTLSEINDFLKNKESGKSVVNIKIDPSILGGAIFIVNGKYIDMSVAGKLNQTFQNNKIDDFISKATNT